MDLVVWRNILEGQNRNEINNDVKWFGRLQIIWICIHIVQEEFLKTLDMNKDTNKLKE